MSRRRIFFAPVLLGLVLSVASPVTADNTTCVCPAHDAGWALLPGDAVDVPDFLFEDFVDVERMVACDHGVFFMFPTTFQGEERLGCLAYLKPSQEVIGEYMVSDTLNALDRAQDTLIKTAQAMEAYDAFRNDLAGLLGAAYEENTLIHFDRRGGRRPRVAFDYGQITLSWYGRQVEFQALVDVFFAGVDFAHASE
jgi:hypothetical protein